MRVAILVLALLAPGCGDRGATPHRPDQPAMGTAPAAGTAPTAGAAAVPEAGAPPARGTTAAKADDRPASKIEVVAKGEGRPAKEGDLALVHLTCKLAQGDHTITDTRAEGEPQLLTVGSGQLLPAMEESLAKMRQGDHWKIRAPYQRMWGERGYPGLVPPRSDIDLDMELVGFVDLKTESLAKGSGPPPVPGEYLLLHEVATLADGKVIEDTRKADAPQLAVIGVGQLVPGLEYVLRQIRIGDRIKVTLPWRLAFGARGKPAAAPPPTELDVPPKSDVTYDIERIALPEISHEVLAEGKGPPCMALQTVSVHYTGTLLDGTKFDSSRDRGQPFQFVLGQHGVIAGWELTVVHMRVGDRWKVRIPWQLAYGARGSPPAIPPKADLVFDMEVMSVK